MYDDLARLLGGYFHQDFVDVHGSPDAAVRAFAAGAPDVAAGTVRDIDALLAGELTEPRLTGLLTELGSCYDVHSDGYDARGWLAHVRELLTAELRRLAAFTVVVAPGDLERTASGAVTGPIWVRAAGTDFPEAGWTDFPVALIGGWLTELTAPREPTTLRFLEGPYELRLARAAAPDRWTLTARRTGAPPAVRTELALALAIDRLRHAGTAVAAYCRSRGWTDHDLEHLATILRT